MAKTWHGTLGVVGQSVRSDACRETVGTHAHYSAPTATFAMNAPTHASANM